MEICRGTLRLHILGRMCTQDDENGSFWKEDTKVALPSLRSAQAAEWRRLKVCPETSAPSIVNDVGL